MPDTPLLSIVVPAYNEELCIGPLIQQILKVPIGSVGFRREIIVVDDGSTDATATIAAGFPEIKLIRQRNAGKGNAVRTGISKAAGDFILIQDADLEYNPRDYIPMLSAIKVTPPNVVYGSRTKGVIASRGWRWPFPGKHEQQGIGPWGMNLVLMLLTYVLYGRVITDMLTAYKIYPMEALRKIRTVTNGFETDHELTAKLCRLGFKIVEVPVRYTPRSREQGKKIRAVDGLIAICTLFRFRIFG